MERLDLYTAAGQRTGRTIPRGAPLAPDDYLLVVHVWIRDEAGHYLIQQRALDRADAPGVWAVTAGHVQARRRQPHRPPHRPRRALTRPPESKRAWRWLGPFTLSSLPPKSAYNLAVS